MRLSLPARWFVLSASLTAAACADDASGRRAEPFDSPYGPGGSVVCTQSEYRVGAACVPRMPLDGGVPARDAGSQRLDDDAGPLTPAPAWLDAGAALGAAS